MNAETKATDSGTKLQEQLLPIGLSAQAACLLEVTARKPGNVHRYRDFDDTSYLDFLLSASAIGPVMEAAAGRRVGTTVLEAVEATRRVTKANTNLGIVLLLAPLAAVPRGEPLKPGVERVLAALDVEDARLVCRAIRLAAPGGLGRASEQDIHEEPTLSLREVMALAAERDLIARQYANGFREVFEEGLPALVKAAESHTLETVIILCHLHWMARHPDSLIARKGGQVEAEESAARARRVLDAGWPEAPGSAAMLEELDMWLRAEGNRRNPGTTADLVTACLFVALREAMMRLPSSRIQGREFSAPGIANGGSGHD